jgi:hypothetical protein
MRGGGMDRLFEQTGGIGLDLTGLSGSLARQRRFNLGGDVNSDGHGCTFPAIPTVPRRTPLHQAPWSGWLFEVRVFGNPFPLFRGKAHLQMCSP